MEDAFVIKGGKPLKGHVELSGAKNIALKVLIGALLFDGKVVLHNIPRINDIQELMHLLTLLGAKAMFTGPTTVELDASHMKSNRVDLLHASKIRVSFMLFAPLLHKFGAAYIPNPGGCRLGARSIDRVVEGLKSLGIQVKYDSETGYYEAKMDKKPYGQFTFTKSSHTGTELMIMLSVFNESQIHIHNAAQEPEIDDLINFLNEGGAHITRSGSDIVIEGVKQLTQSKPFTISSDRVEAATYAALGIATKGDITISTIPDHFIATFVHLLQQAGAGVEKVDGNWRFYYKPYKAMKVETAPHPGFLTDWQPVISVLMTQAEGESVIHERIFENRFSYVEELRKVGAKIAYVDYPIHDPKSHYFFNYEEGKEYTQTIQISGPQQLHSGVLTVADLRAGATLAIAALIAEGESYVTGVHHLERGYEKFVEKVQQLGGDIKKI